MVPSIVHENAEVSQQLPWREAPGSLHCASMLPDPPSSLQLSLKVMGYCSVVHVVRGFTDKAIKAALKHAHNVVP